MQRMGKQLLRYFIKQSTGDVLTVVFESPAYYFYTSDFDFTEVYLD